MVDVFISYSRKDSEAVARLAKRIEEEGYDVWWDAELPPHQSYGDVISSKIAAAKAAVVVWSEDAAASEWVRAEADMARNQRKLVQTALGDIMPPLPFNQIQYADIGDWNGEDDHPSWRKIKASLADLCGREGAQSDHKPAFAPPHPTPSPPPPTRESEPANAAPATTNKWPLVAGIGIGGAAIAVTALMLQPGANDDTDIVDVEAEPATREGETDQVQTENEDPPPQATRPDIPENWILATVEDPDGHSNVRARPTTASAIVSRVQVGETFRTRREAGNWWPVELSDGTKGYIAKRLIRVRGNDDNPQVDRNMPRNDGTLLPDSSDELIVAEELIGMSAAELRIARNEIYARKGFIFESTDLTDYFERFDWYSPTQTSVQLSPVEKANVETIKRLERANGN